MGKDLLVSSCVYWQSYVSGGLFQWNKGLSSQLTVSWRPPSILCQVSLQNGHLLHQSMPAEKAKELANKMEVIILCNINKEMTSYPLP